MHKRIFSNRYTYARTSIHTDTGTQTSVREQVDLQSCICIITDDRTLKYIHIHINTHMHVHVHAHIPVQIHEHMQICMHLHTHRVLPTICTFIYICTDIKLHTYMDEYQIHFHTCHTCYIYIDQHM